MQSIWSVPQTQRSKKKPSNKMDIGGAFKKMFLQPNKNKKQPLQQPFQQQVHNFNYQAPPQQFQPIQPKQNFFQPTIPTPAAIHHQPIHHFDYLAKPEVKKGIDIKNLAATIHLIIPIALAVLGIPFYIMIILKIIHLLH